VRARTPNREGIPSRGACLRLADQARRRLLREYRLVAAAARVLWLEWLPPFGSLISQFTGREKISVGGDFSSLNSGIRVKVKKKIYVSKAIFSLKIKQL